MSSVILITFPRRDWGTVKVMPQLDTGQIEDGGRKIDMRRHGVLDKTCCDAWSADVQGNANVLVEATFLTRRETVLTEVVAVVGRVDDVGVIEDACLIELCDDLLDDLIHALKSLQPGSVEVVNVGDGLVVELE